MFRVRIEKKGKPKDDPAAESIPISTGDAVSIPLVTEVSSTLQELLDQHLARSQTSKFQDEAKNETIKVDANEEFSILPQYMVVELVRNTLSPVSVPAPLELIIPRADNVKVKYMLYAIVVHKGSEASGHYYCYGRTSFAALNGLNQWFKFDDSRVTAVDYDDDVAKETSQNYVHFYVRV